MSSRSPGRGYVAARQRRLTGARLVAVGLGGVLLAVAGQVPTQPAQASPALGGAQQQATQLRHQVDALAVQTEQAAEAYNSATAALGAAVTATVLAGRQLQDAWSASAASRSVAAARTRSLYVSGGQTALYAALLDGQNIADTLTRYGHVQRVVAADDAVVARAADAVGRADAIASSWQAAAASRVRRERSAATAATRVHDLLTAQSRLLADADDEVVRIAEQDRQAERAAAERAFLAELAAAQATKVATATATAGSWAAPVGTTPASPGGGAALAEARRQLGKPYVWGAAGADAFDCSGLTSWAYAHAGVQLPRVAAEQWNAGPHVALADLAPGDLLFWASSVGDPATIHHVAIYAGSGRMIAAPHTGALVQDQAVYLDGYLGAVRPWVSP